MSHSTELSAAASSRLWLRRDRPILACGFMLLAAVILVLNYFIKFPTLPDEAAVSFRQYCEKKLPLQIETSDATTLERYFEADGFSSPLRILDPADCTLRGGGVQRVLNRKSYWYAYQGPENERFVFQVYPGKVGELPAGAEIRWDRGISFHIYSHEGATIVCWQEMHLYRILITDASKEAAIRFAQASMES